MIHDFHEYETLLKSVKILTLTLRKNKLNLLTYHTFNCPFIELACLPQSAAPKNVLLFDFRLLAVHVKSHIEGKC